MVLLAFFRLRSLLSFGDFQFVRRLLPFVHLVVVFGFQLVVSLVVGFVVLGRFGEFTVVIRDLLLQIGQRCFDRFDRLAELAQEFFLLFLLFVGQLARRAGFRRRLFRGSVLTLHLLQGFQFAFSRK